MPLKGGVRDHNPPCVNEASAVPERAFAYLRWMEARNFKSEVGARLRLSLLGAR